MQKYKNLRADQPSIPINEAFSGLHGEELEVLSTDIVMFRKELLVSLKNTKSLDSTRQYLETKVINYIKQEYDNKYGRLERLNFEDDEELEEDEEGDEEEVEDEEDEEEQEGESDLDSQKKIQVN